MISLRNFLLTFMIIGGLIACDEQTVTPEFSADEVPEHAKIVSQRQFVVVNGNEVGVDEYERSIVQPEVDPKEESTVYRDVRPEHLKSPFTSWKYGGNHVAKRWDHRTNIHFTTRVNNNHSQFSNIGSNTFIAGVVHRHFKAKNDNLGPLHTPRQIGTMMDNIPRPSAPLRWKVGTQNHNPYAGKLVSYPTGQRPVVFSKVVNNPQSHEISLQDNVPELTQIVSTANSISRIKSSTYNTTLTGGLEFEAGKLFVKAKTTITLAVSGEWNHSTERVNTTTNTAEYRVNAPDYRVAPGQACEYKIEVIGQYNNGERASANVKLTGDVYVRRTAGAHTLSGHTQYYPGKAKYIFPDSYSNGSFWTDFDLVYSSAPRYNETIVCWDL